MDHFKMLELRQIAISDKVGIMVGAFNDAWNSYRIQLKV
jgi:hypothetical protein